MMEMQDEVQGGAESDTVNSNMYIRKFIEVHLFVDYGSNKDFSQADCSLPDSRH